MSDNVMSVKRLHPFFECFTFRRYFAQVALKSFHNIFPVNNCGQAKYRLDKRFFQESTRSTEADVRFAVYTYRWIITRSI